MNRMRYVFLRVIFLWVASATHAASLPLFSDSFESGTSGQPIHGAVLDNGLGGTIRTAWFDPGGYGTYQKSGSSLGLDYAPAPWDEFKVLAEYPLDPTQTYALEFRQHPPDGVLGPDPWNPHGGAVILSRHDQSMTSSGIVLRLQGPDPTGWDPNLFSIYYQDGSAFFQQTPVLSGTIAAADRDHTGCIPVRLVFHGAGTSASPCEGQLFLNGNDKGSFAIADLANPGNMVGLITQSSPTSSSHGWTDDFKLTQVPREQVLLSETFSAGGTGAAIDGQPLDNELGGSGAAVWYDPGHLARYSGSPANRYCRLVPTVWDTVKIICTYELDPNKTYALETMMRPAAGQDGTWNRTGGPVLFSGKNQSFEAGGICTRIANYEANTDAPESVGMIDLSGNQTGGFAWNSLLVGGPVCLDETADIPSDNYLPVRIIFNGAGNSTHPLRGRILVNGHWKADFYITNLAGAGVYFGFQSAICDTQSMRIRSFKLSEIINPEPLNTLSLQYSTLGYDLRATKRALLHVGSADEANRLAMDSSRWELLDASASPVQTGTLAPLPLTYGERLWEMNFSSQTQPGNFSLRVSLRDTAGHALPTLDTTPFPIEAHLHFVRTFEGIALANAEARASSAEDGGGYYDCNSKMGEAYSHGAFLAGLSLSWRRYQARLSTHDRQRLRAAANRAADYLLLLHDSTTGEIQHQYPTRPSGAEDGSGVWNTFEGLWGLANYAAAFRDEEPSRSADCYTRGRLSYTYLQNHASLYPDHAAAFRALFHAYQPDAANKQALIAAVNTFIMQFDLKNWTRGTGRCIPYFVGLHYCVTNFPDDPNRNAWLAAANRFNTESFQEMLARNAYCVLPQGSITEWNNVAAIPPGETDYHLYCNTHFCTAAADAILLAELTGDNSLERMATGALGWITGLHPGVAGDRVTPAESGSGPLAASFLINLPGKRYATPWSWFEWSQPSDSYLSIVNGMTIGNGGHWYYTDHTWFSGETFIKHDGAYLYATALYEDYLENKWNAEHASGVPYWALFD